MTGRKTETIGEKEREKARKERKVTSAVLNIFFSPSSPKLNFIYWEKIFELYLLRQKKC